MAKTDPIEAAIGYVEALDTELMNAQIGTTDSYATPGEAINALIEKSYQKGWRDARTNQTLNNGGTVIKDGVEYRAATGRARIAELEAERAELVKDRERLRDLVRDAWVEGYVHTALDDVKTDPMCLAGLEMEAIEDWGESTAKSRLDAAREVDNE